VSDWWIWWLWSIEFLWNNTDGRRILCRKLIIRWQLSVLHFMVDTSFQEVKGQSQRNT